MPEPFWQIAPLHPRHDLSEFDCQHFEFNYWLPNRAARYQKLGWAWTYVALAPPNRRAFGYYSLAHHRITDESRLNRMTNGQPNTDLSVILIDHLAVDHLVQRNRLGERLLLDALRRAAHVAPQLGSTAVQAYALNDGMREFYLRYGFSPLPDNRYYLFLPMPTILKLKLSPPENFVREQIPA